MIPREYCENELLAEIFGFLPQRYFDELYDYMNAIMHNVIEGVNERLEDMHKDKAIEIFHIIRAFENKLEIRLDDCFNTLQQYVYSYAWKIPNNLNIELFNHAIDLNLTKDKELELDENIKSLKRKIRAEQLFNSRLKRDLASIESQKKSIEPYQQLATMLREAKEKHQVLNTEDAVEKIIYQLDVLKQLMEDVYAKIKNQPSHVEPDEKIKRLRKNIKELIDAQS
ncbi:hypothetical protein CU097_015532 [Rhizopus azygosporus]|uniref:Protein MIS12 homolog n=1 Tax=Rhizopus azygosporus TaxID=86630 RepID=A0A367KDE5_RHIAZ|nr:hypothetical protein CU097_015532 [Rhizopus azygosporus]